VALKDQILALDSKLRGAAFRGALSERDAAVLASVDSARFEAFKEYLADKVAARYYLERFPGSLEGCARVLQGDGQRAAVAAAIMSSAHFDQVVGEDVTGAAFFAWFCDERERWPEWLWEVGIYEYLVACGLPRRANGETVSEALEARLYPDLQVFAAPALASGSWALARPAVFVNFDYPVRELSEVLACGGRFEAEVEVEPYSAALILGEEGVLELEASWPHADVLQLCVQPQSAESLSSMLGIEIDGIRDVLSELEGLGVLASGGAR
jgi:hypothetical protein